MSVSCPGCGAPLSGEAACPACDLSLVGPAAGQLWEVDQRLALLERERLELLSQRGTLLHSLRAEPSASAGPFVVTSPVPGGRPVSGAPFPPPPLMPGPPAREANPHQVQNTLLALGALLLAVAGVVFAAVTYRYLGPVGRALILLLLTGAAALAPVVLVKRALAASAEAVAAVALVLGILDAWVLRRAGLGQGADARSYAAVAAALLAVAAAGYAVAIPLRVARVAAVVLAQLPLALVLARAEPPTPVVAVLLAGMAALDLLAAWERRLPPDVRLTAVAMATGNLIASLLASAVAIREDDAGAGLGIVAVALVLAAASTRQEDAVLRAGLSGLPVPLLAIAAAVTSRPSLTHDQRPLVLAAVALLALTASATLPTRYRPGPVLGGLVVIAGGVASQTEPVLVALGGPFSWLAQPWTLRATEARQAVTVDVPWTGTVITLVVVAVAAVGLVMAGMLLDRLEAAVMPAGALLAVAAAVLPLGLATSYPIALAVLVLCAAGLSVAAWFADALRQQVLAGAAAVLALLAAVWASADEDATLVVLPLLTLVAAGLAVRLAAAVLAAALLAGAALASYGAASGWDRAEVGLLLLAVPAACAGLSFVLRLTHRLAVECAAVILAGASVVLAAEDPAWLSVCLGVSGLLSLAVAIRPDRRAAGLAGGLLLSASSWVRLADAHVHAPEPYAAPLAVTALVFGYLRRRSGGSSFEAYGAGLAVALVPTLLRSMADDSPARGLGLLVVCVLVVLAGASWRLRAPLVIGGGVLVLDALHLMAPFARALPRWSLLAVAGAVLLGVGLTYEARRRDLARLKTRYDQLS